jgi:hypothetical protein
MSHVLVSLKSAWGVRAVGGGGGEGVGWEVIGKEKKKGWRGAGP